MKVLLAAMSLGIGGAETHVVELAKALSRAGVSVTVASAGGVYEASLTEAGIPHVKVPLHRKNPLSLLVARRKLAALMKRENFDIVHAHARISAFLCHALQGRFGYHFVTTDHLDFKVTPLWRRLSHWGERTFVVSEDLGRYLTEQYAVRRENIVLTINGIDTDAFSPNADGTALRASLAQGERPIVLHVSRLDEPTTRCAEALIDAVSALGGAVSLTIVGSGDRFAQVSAKAENVNRALGFPAVTMAGAQTKIADYLAACDLFVGSSRAAMEAMACGKPVLLAGPQGYGGFFRESCIEAAVKSNFCFRGSELPTAEILIRDLRTFLEADAPTRDALGAFACDYIAQNYSVERMMRTQLATYESLVPRELRHTDLLLCGYYGYGNMGDEQILGALVEGIRKQAPDLGICVMSAHPKRTAERYGVLAVHRFRPLAVRKKMNEASLFLFGGGNLLQDKTSTHSLLYYCGMIRLAKRRGKAIMLYDSGIGPLTKRRNRARVQAALALADTFSFRERVSFNYAKSALPNANLRLTFDPAILTKPDETCPIETPYFLVAPKAFDGADQALVAWIRATKEKTALCPVVLALYPAQDRALCEQIAAETGAVIASPKSGTEIVSLFSHARFALSARLHGLIYATSAACPMLSFSDDSKLSSYLDYIGLGAYASTPSATNVGSPDMLNTLTDRLLEAETDVHRVLACGVPMWRTLAEYEFSEVVRATRKARSASPISNQNGGNHHV